MSQPNITIKSEESIPFVIDCCCPKPTTIRVECNFIKESLNIGIFKGWYWVRLAGSHLSSPLTRWSGPSAVLITLLMACPIIPQVQIVRLQ